jgi:hypothetical protein
MTRDHFKQTFNSPYFQSSYYREETPGGNIENKIESLLKKFFGPKHCITFKKLSEARRKTFKRSTDPKP